MHLNFHARFEIAAVMALLLGSCGGPSLSEKQKEEVGDIAGDAAPDTSALESKIEDLESRLSDAELKLSDVDGRVSDVETKLAM